MQLVIATYERFLLGYSVTAGGAGGDGEAPGTAHPPLRRSFTHAAHQGPVRCLAAGGPWVVSGGQDDQLHIYDVKAGKDLGFVMNPGDGAITCLAFHTPHGASRPSHLLSGSDDGSIAIWRAGGDWEALKLLRGHKGPVRSVSVHPSGRLAVSVGHDRLLKLWHLGKGRCSYTARLEAEADSVAFSADGESYALVTDKLVSLHSVASEGGLIARLEHSRRVTALLLPPPSTPAAAAAPGGSSSNGTAASALLLSGCDDGQLCMWSVAQPAAPVWELPGAHKSRIRAITAVTPGVEGGLPLVIATASSDGVVQLWDSSALGDSDASPTQRLVLLGSVSTSGRVTGMVLAAPERAAAAAAAGGGEDAAAQAAVHHQQHKLKRQLKKKRKQEKEQQQASAVQPARPAKQPAKQQCPQQQQQLRNQQQPAHKKQRRQQQQQQQRDDDGFEVVPAPKAAVVAMPAAFDSDDEGGDGGAQQQHTASAGAGKRQQRGKKQRQHATAVNGAGSSDGAAPLVPRVQTVIKKQRAGPGGAAAAAAARGGRGAGAAGSKPQRGWRPPPPGGH